MIHPREQEILNILWKTNKGMTSSDIVEVGSRLSQSTVQAVLRKLLKEGLIEIDGVTHSGNVLSRTYRPAEKSKEVVLQQFIEQYKGISNIVSRGEVIKALEEVKIC